MARKKQLSTNALTRSIAGWTKRHERRRRRHASGTRNVFPGYEAWPSGYTIGPIDKLKSMSPKKRANYIRKKLRQLHQLGWMIAEVAPWYDQNLTADNLEQVVGRATEDLKAGRITSEVDAMIQSMQP